MASRNKPAGKTLTLTCDECRTARTFEGANVGAIIKAIDAARWHDFPGGALCPECDEAKSEREDAERGWGAWDPGTPSAEWGGWSG